MFVVILFDSLDFMMPATGAYGPFENRDAAHKFANAHLDNGKAVAIYEIVPPPSEPEGR